MEGGGRRSRTEQERREAGGRQGRRTVAHAQLESLDFNLWAMGSCGRFCKPGREGAEWRQGRVACQWCMERTGRVEPGEREACGKPAHEPPTSGTGTRWRLRA